MAANLPTPDDLLAEERRKELEANPSFQQHLSKLPYRRQVLITTWLANPLLSLNEVAKKAGYKVGPNSKVQHIFKQVQGQLGSALMELGVTQADILKTVMEGLKATDVIAVRNASGAQSLVEVPNHAVRLKTAEMLLKLGDYFPAKKFKGSIDHTLSPGAGFKEKTLAELREIDRKVSSGEDITELCGVSGVN